MVASLSIASEFHQYPWLERPVPDGRSTDDGLMKLSDAIQIRDHSRTLIDHRPPA
jgi:hypothetical protein